VWTTGILQPYQTVNIVVTVNVAIGLPVGTIINSGAVIEPIAGDSNPGCNTDYWEILTTGSVDPNDVAVNRITLLNTEFPNPPYLQYLIRFQNTGNDTAFTVKLENNISTDLKIETLEIMSASHPMSVNYQPSSRLMTFRFNNILLPDDNTNEPLSHGFVRYRIQPVDSLITGDQIKNTAQIYFDYNDPVATNTAITTVVLPTAVSNEPLPENSFELYPNPAKKFLTLKYKTDVMNLTVAVTDISGRTVLKKMFTSFNKNSSAEIDIESLSNGIYLLEVTAGDKIIRRKFVKQ